ncbi:MAG TPA: hypothetical protein VGP01_03240 [Rhizomicrobium sp.]|jgi:hypothetical protein|nr:hypothetical protein [Rhizomicrobium sp.]
MAELAQWDSFYVIMGSAAGALIGLQFVVMTLVAGNSTTPTPQAGAAFAAPTIVHFGAVLFLAAVLRMPWPSVASVALLLRLAGLAGLIYALIVARRMRRQTDYKPDFEDWSFHFLLPLAAYALMLAAAFGLFSYPRASLFGVGGATLLLLYVGIHNSWDGVVYQVFVTKRGRPPGDG